MYCEAVGRAAVWEHSSDSVLASLNLLLPFLSLSACVMCHLSQSFPNTLQGSVLSLETPLVVNQEGFPVELHDYCFKKS